MVDDDLVKVANDAYHAMVAEAEEDGGVWWGFSHQRDAWESGFQVGYRAAQRGKLPPGAEHFPVEGGIQFEGKTYFPADYVLTRMDIQAIRDAALADQGDPPTTLALIARLRAAEAKIEVALNVARSGSVPLGVPEVRHYDRLLAEVRRALTTDTEGAS